MTLSGYVRAIKLEEYVTLVKFTELAEKVELMEKEIATLKKENNQQKGSIYENQDKIVKNNQRYEVISKRVLEIDKMKEDIINVSKNNNSSSLIKKNDKAINDEIDMLKRAVVSETPDWHRLCLTHRTPIGRQRLMKEGRYGRHNII